MVKETLLSDVAISIIKGVGHALAAAIGFIFGLRKSKGVK